MRKEVFILLWVETQLFVFLFLLSPSSLNLHIHILRLRWTVTSVKYRPTLLNFDQKESDFLY